MLGILLLNAAALVAVIIALPLWMIGKNMVRDHRIKCGIEEAWRKHEKVARKINGYIERGEKPPEGMREEIIKAACAYDKAMFKTSGIYGFREDMERKYPLTKAPWRW